MSASRWDVYHLFCHQVQPEPKYKFVVVTYLDENWFFGLLINSKINEFYLRRPKLLPCMVQILQSQHSEFLRHDSYVDCTKVMTFGRSELSEQERRGKLRGEAVEALLKGIDNCMVIKQVHKDLLLS